MPVTGLVQVPHLLLCLFHLLPCSHVAHCSITVVCMQPENVIHMPDHMWYLIDLGCTAANGPSLSDDAEMYCMHKTAVVCLHPMYK